MAIGITQDQLNQVLAKIDGNNKDVAGAWKLLASYGDGYAVQAYTVISDPTSFYGIAVRDHWANTGADFGKFQEVALQHVRQYVDMIGKEKGQSELWLSDGQVAVNNDPRNARSSDGLLLLPKTAPIEESYRAALTAAGMKPETAIDLVINRGLVPFAWYGHSPIGLGFEAARVSSFENYPSGVSRSSATALIGKTMVDMLYSLFQKGVLPSGQSLSDVMVQMTTLGNLFPGGNDIRVETQGGFSYYYNNKTGTAAMIDRSGRGKAFYNGKEIDVSPDNFRRNSSGGFDIRLNNGSWTGAGLDYNETVPRFIANEIPGHSINFTASSGDQKVASNDNGGIALPVLVSGVYNNATSLNGNDIGSRDAGAATIQAIRERGLTNLANVLQAAYDASSRIISDAASRAALSAPYSNFDAFISKINAIGKNLLDALNGIDAAGLTPELQGQLAAYKADLSSMSKVLVWGRLVNKLTESLQVFGEKLGTIAGALQLLAFTGNPAAAAAGWARSVPGVADIGLSMLVGGMMGSASAIAPGLMTGTTGGLYFLLMGSSTWSAYATKTGQNFNQVLAIVANALGMPGTIADPSQIPAEWKAAHGDLVNANVLKAGDGALIAMSSAGVYRINADHSGVSASRIDYLNSPGIAVRTADQYARDISEQQFGPNGQMNFQSQTLYDASGRKVSMTATGGVDHVFTVTYNPDGSRSEQMFNTASGKWVWTHEFDAAGLATKSIEATGNGNVSTTTFSSSNNNTVTTVTDGSGRIVQVTNWQNGFPAVASFEYFVDGGMRITTQLPDGRNVQNLNADGSRTSDYYGLDGHLRDRGVFRPDGSLAEKDIFSASGNIFSRGTYDATSHLTLTVEMDDAGRIRRKYEYNQSTGNVSKIQDFDEGGGLKKDWYYDASGKFVRAVEFMGHGAEYITEVRPDGSIVSYNPTAPANYDFGKALGPPRLPSTKIPFNPIVSPPGLTGSGRIIGPPGSSPGTNAPLPILKIQLPTPLPGQSPAPKPNYPVGVSEPDCFPGEVCVVIVGTGGDGGGGGGFAPMTMRQNVSLLTQSMAAFNPVVSGELTMPVPQERSTHSVLSANIH
ncbi:MULTISPECIES: RHS repeat protein [Burkholderia cepacia complex]|uniref:RHS repeat protein n=1 Tax=Burkholderia cepacia complex TaxID=87882 RepID=UPI000A9078E8|nr:MULTISPECIES: RHS repeat protein [Burkholderia cepacia complex]